MSDEVEFDAKATAQDCIAEGFVTPTIANYKMVPGEKKPVPVPLTMPEILTTAREHLKGWPRMIDQMPFIDEAGRDIQMFDRNVEATLLGWMQGFCKVDWHNGSGFITKGEFIAELTRTSERYTSVETYPHEPLIPGVYYRVNTIKPGDGQYLKTLLARYCPETTVDLELLKGAALTLFRGGSPGSNPVFVVTSDEGRGVGKTKCVETLVYLTGETPIYVSPSDSIDSIKTRLLSKDGRRKRTVLLDNIKSRKLSWADLEQLITAASVGGKQLYVGHGERTNHLTYFMTLNAAALSKDMAQRSVVIKLVRGSYNGAWLEETKKYIDTYRNEIIGDIIAALRSEPVPVDDYTRWSEWERDVLGRLRCANELQDTILERRGICDTDMDSASLLEEYFAARLAGLPLPYDPLTAQLRIPNSVAVDWFNGALGGKEKVLAASKAIRQYIEEGDMKCLSVDTSRTHGRCFIWTGKNADVTKPIMNDLKQRMDGFTNVLDESSEAPSC